jgi:tetratricopeptide (TPR) repeat protein
LSCSPTNPARAAPGARTTHAKGGQDEAMNSLDNPAGSKQRAMAMASPDRRSAGAGNPPPAIPIPLPAAPSFAPPELRLAQPWNGRDWLFILAVFAAVFLAYQPVWHAGFVWDDGAHLTPPELRSWRGLSRIWFELGATQQYYPLVHSAFWAEHRIFGEAAAGYHLVNLFLHALNAVLIGLILRRLRMPGAYLAAGIFALHPVMVESVAWITEIKNTLSGLFYLSAGMAYLRFDENRRPPWHALALGLFALGLLSKTVTATLPGALLVVFWWRRGRLSWREDVRPLLLFFILGAAGGLFTAWVEWKIIGARGAAFTFTLVERGLIAGRVVWFYLGKLAWPAELVFIYPRWLVGQAEGWQYLFPTGLLLGLGLLWKLRHRSRGPLAGALFFIGTLFPVLGFFNVYPFLFSFVADHFQYLASLGMIVTAAAGLEQLWRSQAWPRGVAAGGLSLGLLAGLGVLTWRQSRDYRDEKTLYEMTLARNPSCWMAHNNLGFALFQMGRTPEAMRQYREALRLKPDYAEASNNLGFALVQTGRVPEAMEQYREALRLNPEDAAAHNNLGYALVQTGRVPEALPQYREALRLNPALAEAHFNRGTALVKVNRMPEALREYVEALRIKPGYAEAHFNLGCALVQAGRVSEAMPHFGEALRIKPGYAQAHNNFGFALAQAGRVPEAIAHYREAIRLQPDYASAYYNLGNALLVLGRAPEAIAPCQDAVRLDSNNAAAHNNLGIALLQAGRMPEAVAQYEEAVRIQSDYADAHSNLGYALMQMDRVPEAIREYETVLRIEPDNTGARENLTRLRTLPPAQAAVVK